MLRTALNTALVLIFITLPMACNRKDSGVLPPNANPKIVGTWRKQNGGGDTYVVRFLDSGTMVYHQVVYEPKDTVARFSASDKTLVVAESDPDHADKESGLLEFPTDNEMIIGNMSSEGWLRFRFLSGSWKKVMPGPEADLQAFLDEVNGEWRMISNTDVRLQVTKDAVSFKDTAGTWSVPCTIDGKGKVISLTTPDKSEMTIKSPSDGQLVCTFGDGSKTLLFRRQGWGEDFMKEVEAKEESEKQRQHQLAVEFLRALGRTSVNSH